MAELLAFESVTFDSSSHVDTESKATVYSNQSISKVKLCLVHTLIVTVTQVITWKISYNTK